MKQKEVLTKNNDLLNVMFRGTPCSTIYIHNIKVVNKIVCLEDDISLS